ncbi:hypothetical protein AJ78_04745 [Emergomyces pasteurianus Ep9510]|uniref:Uncharacterized protein n=1 Tax=Emergomyces pasteurianus Ep9510 TaxID=1447872 RepID=A0A1J9PGD0_9EURO|nr:hypothetical protein AJ78_04745 [Emergomyces pasteurianus Ep9510]
MDKQFTWRPAHGSTDSPAHNISTNCEDVVSDLQELADLLSSRNMRLTYENWCWSTYVPHGKLHETSPMKSTDQISACVSTPSRPPAVSGRIEKVGGVVNINEAQLNERFKQGLDELAKTVPAV